MYGSFDLVLDDLALIPQLYTTLHAPCDMPHVVRWLI